MIFNYKNNVYTLSGKMFKESRITPKYWSWRQYENNGWGKQGKPANGYFSYFPTTSTQLVSQNDKIIGLIISFWITVLFYFIIDKFVVFSIY